MKTPVRNGVENEEKNIAKCLAELRGALRERQIPYEAIVVNDNSTDGTRAVVEAEMAHDQAVRLVNRRPPGCFGRAVRAGLDAVAGDIVVVYMADCSDDAQDLVKYYRKIVDEGYDCVFGSRFIKGSKVENYPKVKLVVNRIVNLADVKERLRERVHASVAEVDHQELWQRAAIGLAVVGADGGQVRDMLQSARHIVDQYLQAQVLDWQETTQ